MPKVPAGRRASRRRHRHGLTAALLALLAGWALGAPASRAAAAGAAAGDRPPSRLRLSRPAAPLVPGQQAVLGLDTLGEGGQPLAAQHAITVTLAGAAGLTAATQVVVAAGSSHAEVPISPTRPGLWQVEARARGLYSASTVMVCVSPAVLARHQTVAAAHPARTATTTGAAPRTGITALPPASHGPTPPSGGTAPSGTEAQPGSTAPHATKAAAGTAAASGTTAAHGTASSSGTTAPHATAAAEKLAATRVHAATPPPATAAHVERIVATAGAAAITGSARGGGAAAASGGEVRLIPEHLQRYRGTQGWESVSVDAYWYANGNPSPAPHALDVVLEADQGDLHISPVRLTIPPGDFVSQQPAVVTAAAAVKGSLEARYPGGESNAVDVSFLVAPATQLSFSSGPQVIRGFGVVSSEVYVRMLDATGVPAVADDPVQVNVQLSGPLGSPQISPAVIPAGQIEARVPIDLPRIGAYTVVASAAGFADTPPLSIEVAFDWLLLLATLLGGLLGSLTRVLYQGRSVEETPRRLLRVLLLGSLAALLVVLLAAFGLLSLLAGALPQGWSDALAKVPLGSLTGVFLLGYLAGLLFDRVFGSLVSNTVPSSAPNKPAAPAGGA